MLNNIKSIKLDIISNRKKPIYYISLGILGIIILSIILLPKDNLSRQTDTYIMLGFLLLFIVYMLLSSITRYKKMGTIKLSKECISVFDNNLNIEINNIRTIELWGGESEYINPRSLGSSGGNKNILKIFTKDKVIAERIFFKSDEQMEYFFQMTEYYKQREIAFTNYEYHKNALTKHIEI